MKKNKTRITLLLLVAVLLFAGIICMVSRFGTRAESAPAKAVHAATFGGPQLNTLTMDKISQNNWKHLTKI